MKIIGLIPARGGSKNIEKKNITLLNNNPLIYYTIKAASESKLIDKVIVSTDDEEIASVAKKFGAEVPFIRPSEYSEDSSKDIDVIKHLFDWGALNNLKDINLIAYLRPTTPFKTAAIIDNCISTMKSGNFSSVRTVTEVEGVFHPYWMFKSKNDILTPFINSININEYYQRQLLPKCLRLNGVVDVIKKDQVLKNDLWGDKIGYVETKEYESIDIDNEIDLKFCEFIMNDK